MTDINTVSKIRQVRDMLKDCEMFNGARKEEITAIISKLNTLDSQMGARDPKHLFSAGALQNQTLPSGVIQFSLMGGSPVLTSSRISPQKIASDTRAAETEAYTMGFVKDISKELDGKELTQLEFHRYVVERVTSSSVPEHLKKDVSSKVISHIQQFGIET
jgi:hypothetical protein